MDFARCTAPWLGAWAPHFKLRSSIYEGTMTCPFIVYCYFYKFFKFVLFQNLYPQPNQLFDMIHKKKTILNMNREGLCEFWQSLPIEWANYGQERYAQHLFGNFFKTNSDINCNGSNVVQSKFVVKVIFQSFSANVIFIAIFSCYIIDLLFCKN